MILSTRTVDLVADRIERAYLRRYVEMPCVTWDSRIWRLAARGLLEEHTRVRWLPIDPELFVASQGRASATADPWTDLAPPEAIHRYRWRVQRIVRRLRAELQGEVNRAERAIARGRSIEDVCERRRRWLSPIGRLIVVSRANRPDLLDRYRSAAIRQHQSCPLYQRACHTLMPSEAYPVFELIPGVHLVPSARRYVHDIAHPN